MSEAPRTLETERLSLRWFRADDAPLMLSIWNDPDFLRYVGDRNIRTVDAAREAVEATLLPLYENLAYGPYRVAIRASDTPIGICGLFKRDYLEYPDIGYGFLPAYRGQGFALEAARAVLDMTRFEMRLPQLAAIVSPENAPSIALLRKLGFSQDTGDSHPEQPEATAMYRFTELAVDSDHDGQEPPIVLSTS